MRHTTPAIGRHQAQIAMNSALAIQTYADRSSAPTQSRNPFTEHVAREEAVVQREDA